MLYNRFSFKKIGPEHRHCERIKKKICALSMHVTKIETVCWFINVYEDIIYTLLSKNSNIY